MRGSTDSVCCVSKGWLPTVDTIQGGKEELKTVIDNTESVSAVLRWFSLRQSSSKWCEEKEIGNNKRLRKDLQGNTFKKYFLPHPCDVETYCKYLFPLLCLPLHDLPSLWCVSSGLQGLTGTMMVGICSLITLLCHRMWQITDNQGWLHNHTLGSWA